MAINNSLTKQTEAPATLSEFLGREKTKKSLISMLGNEKESQKFVSNILSAVSVNSDLQQCDYSTVVSASLLANALSLSLSPSLGLAYLVPFEDRKNKRKVATFILGYKGYIQLAVRSGYYKKINVLAIKEGELIHYDPLSEEIEVNLIEDDEIRENTPTVGYYAMFEYSQGFRKAIYWSKKKMLIHADRYSKAFKKSAYDDLLAGKIPESEAWKYSSFWYKDFDAMAFKTMLRQLISKWGIMSIDMQEAYEKDSESMAQTDNDFDFMPETKTHSVEDQFFGTEATEDTAQ